MKVKQSRIETSLSMEFNEGKHGTEKGRLSMNIKRFVVFSTAVSIFLFSSLVAWYEGAQIYDNPWEWENTALISNLINEQVVKTPDEIVALDHFIYSAKFQPLFPFLMVISFLAITCILFYPLFKRNTIAFVVSCLLLVLASFIVVFIIGDSPTPGFKVFTVLFGILGVTSSAVLVYLLTRIKKQTVFSR